MAIISLTFAHRIMIANLLTAARKGDLQTARTVSALRSALDLRHAVQEFQDLSDERSEARKRAGATESFVLRNYDDMDDFAPDPVTYHCDNAHLKYVLDLAGKHDWSKATDRDGKEITVPVMMDTLVTFASLVDELQSATGGGK